MGWMEMGGGIIMGEGTEKARTGGVRSRSSRVVVVCVCVCAWEERNTTNLKAEGEGNVWERRGGVCERRVVGILSVV